MTASRGARPDGRRPSLLRPLVVAGEVTAFAVAAHTIAGGSIPDLADLIQLGASIAAVSALLDRRAITLHAAVALSLGAQLLLHLAGSSGSAGHGAHGAEAAGAHGGGAMLLAHAVAAAITVAGLIWQERAAALLIGALTPPRAAAAPLVATAPLCTGVARPHVQESEFVRPWRRGPPGRTTPLPV